MNENQKLVSLENLLATGMLDHVIDLTGITKVVENIDYRSKRFLDFFFRLERPKNLTRESDRCSFKCQ
jgi:TATA-box binding protein (TBP) (component of TFIID and TFIIIB)